MDIEKILAVLREREKKRERESEMLFSVGCLSPSSKLQINCARKLCSFVDHNFISIQFSSPKMMTSFSKLEFSNLFFKTKMLALFKKPFKF